MRRLHTPTRGAIGRRIHRLATGLRLADAHELIPGHRPDKPQGAPGQPGGVEDGIDGLRRCGVRRARPEQRLGIVELRGLQARFVGVEHARQRLALGGRQGGATQRCRGKPGRPQVANGTQQGAGSFRERLQGRPGPKMIQCVTEQEAPRPVGKAGPSCGLKARSDVPLGPGCRGGHPQMETARPAPRPGRGQVVPDLLIGSEQHLRPDRMGSAECIELGDRMRQHEGSR